MAWCSGLVSCETGAGSGESAAMQHTPRQPHTHCPLQAACNCLPVSVSCLPRHGSHLSGSQPLPHLCACASGGRGWVGAARARGGAGAFIWADPTWVCSKKSSISSFVHASMHVHMFMLINIFLCMHSQGIRISVYMYVCMHA